VLDVQVVEAADLDGVVGARAEAVRRDAAQVAVRDGELDVRDVVGDQDAPTLDGAVAQGDRLGGGDADDGLAGGARRPAAGVGASLPHDQGAVAADAICRRAGDQRPDQRDGDHDGKQHQPR
jgi:hypothetical protein